MYRTKNEQVIDSMEVAFTNVKPGETLTIMPKGQRLQIISGTAWVTMGFEDAILYKGQTVILNNIGFRVVVSAVGDQPVLFSVRA